MITRVRTRSASRSLRRAVSRTVSRVMTQIARGWRPRSPWRGIKPSIASADLRGAAEEIHEALLQALVAGPHPEHPAPPPDHPPPALRPPLPHNPHPPNPPPRP